MGACITGIWYVHPGPGSCIVRGGIGHVVSIISGPGSCIVPGLGGRLGRGLRLGLGIAIWTEGLIDACPIPPPHYNCIHQVRVRNSNMDRGASTARVNEVRDTVRVRVRPTLILKYQG